MFRFQIENNVLKNCWADEDEVYLVIPDGVTIIGYEALYHLQNLRRIVVPSGVKIIEERAFGECENLSEIEISETVEEIGKETLFACPHLVKILVSPDNKVFDSREDCNAIIHTSTNELIAGCKATIIPDSVTKIGSYAFEKCYELTEINIPKNVTSIGDYAFEGCDKLIRVIEEDGIRHYGKGVLATFVKTGSFYYLNKYLIEEYHFNNEGKAEFKHIHKQGILRLDEKLDLYFDDTQKNKSILFETICIGNMKKIVISIYEFKEKLNKRIEQDDESLILEIDNIMKNELIYCINYAREVKAVKLLAYFMDYKNKHFSTDYIKELENVI